MAPPATLEHMYTCDACIQFDKYLTANCLLVLEHKWDSIIDNARRTILKPGCPGYKPKRGSHVGNGAPKGVFAGTLTMAPDDGLTKDDMLVAIHKVMQQQSCPVKRYVWYLEYTDAGLPHIHFMYETETGGRIEAKHFKRAWKIWNEKQRCGAGHRGGYHRPVHDEDEYKKYVQKDNSPDHEDTWF